MSVIDGWHQESPWWWSCGEAWAATPIEILGEPCWRVWRYNEPVATARSLAEARAIVEQFSSSRGDADPAPRDLPLGK